MSWATKLATAPTEEPVVLADLKAHMRITTTTEDDYLSALIGAARRVCEQRAGLALVTQTWDLYACEWPDDDDAILPVHPVQSCTYVKYYDSANVLQTLGASVYSLTTFGHSPRLTRAYGQTWPTLYDRPDAVVVRVVAGYGASGASVPHPLRQWIMMHAAGLYEMREAVIDGQVGAHVSPLLDGLLDPYRVPQGM